MDIDFDDFIRFAPNARSPKTLVSALNTILPDYDIIGVDRVAAFLAQLHHESGGFRFREENLNYSAAALERVFSKYFSRAGRNANDYARKPEEIANIVYANRMGNGSISSGDGWTFRGKGYIQLTGKYNTEAFAEDMSISLNEALDYLLTVDGAVEGSAWFWKKNNLNRFADARDIRGLSRAINGGWNGLEDRLDQYERARAIFRFSAPRGPDISRQSESEPRNKPMRDIPNTNMILRYGDINSNVAEMQKALQKLPDQESLPIAADGVFGKKTLRRVRRFQRQFDLPVDGIAGPKTLETLYRTVYGG